MAKLWGGRFTKGTDKAVEDFTSSISFDSRMYKEDVAGSIAHATMLAEQQIISKEDKDAIVAGLQDIEQQINAGDFEFSVALEDIHMNIEKRLTDAIGEAGGRLHTGRSRNDQVAVDLHMYIRKAVVHMGEELVNLQQAFLEVAEKYKDYLSKEDVDSKIKAYEVEKLRTKIALDNGLPYEFANRLQGEDEKSILEDALSIAKLIKGNRSVLPLKNSEGGIDPKRESFKRLVSVLKED